MFLFKICDGFQAVINEKVKFKKPMKKFHKNLNLILFSVLFAQAFFSFEVQAQRRKPGISKETQATRLAYQALREIQSGNYEIAIETLTKCISLKPGQSNAFKCYMGRGTSYYILRKYEQAIPDLTAAYEAFRDESILYYRGRSYFEIKKYEEASKDFVMLNFLYEENRIKKEFPEFYKFRGATLTALDKYDQALDAYQKAIEVDPHPADVYFGRALVFELKGDFVNAEKDLRKSLELDPSSKELVNEVLERIKARKNSATDAPKASGI